MSSPDTAAAAPRASKRLAAVAARIALVSQPVMVPIETSEVYRAIHEACAEYSEKIATLVESVAYDTGRLIATTDLIKHARDTACDAITLPHAGKL